MKPRIFVSSTFYDLKYVREDLKSFIENYGFEPLLFEEGDIGYEPGKQLDESCYDAMRSSDFVVLIIGGQYGSNATKQETDKKENFISITHNEYRSALEKHIPIFAFIDSKVHTEYEVYKANAENIKRVRHFMKFRATKDIRVFDFIQAVYNAGGISVTEFTKVSDIKDFLSKQWADMMKNYLVQRREKVEIESLRSQIDKLSAMLDSMSGMLDEVGKRVINEQSEYDDIKLQQRSKYICKLIYDNFCLIDTKKRSKEQNAKYVLSAFKAAHEINLFIQTDDNIRRMTMTFTEYYHEVRMRFASIGYRIFRYSGPRDFNMADLITEITRELSDSQLSELVIKEIKENYDKIFSDFMYDREYRKTQVQCDED